MLGNMQDQLGNMFYVKTLLSSYCKLQARSPFSLGMMVQHVMNRFIRDGVGFDKLTIDVHEMTMSILIPKHPGRGKMLVEWK